MLTGYLFAVLHHWWAIVIGFVLTIIDVGQRAIGTSWLPPTWAKITTAVLGLFIAQFLAYRELVSASEKEKSTLRQEIARLVVKPYDEQHRKIAEQKLGALDGSSRALVVFLLHRGPTKMDTLRQRCQDAECIFSDGLGRAEREDLIERSEQQRPGRAGIDLYFDIKPAFRTVLEDLLGNAAAGPHYGL